MSKKLKNFRLSDEAIKNLKKHASKSGSTMTKIIEKSLLELGGDAHDKTTVHEKDKNNDEQQ